MAARMVQRLACKLPKLETWVRIPVRASIFCCFMLKLQWKGSCFCIMVSKCECFDGGLVSVGHEHWLVLSIPTTAIHLKEHTKKMLADILLQSQKASLANLVIVSFYFVLLFPVMMCYRGRGFCNLELLCKSNLIPPHR